jgi:FKBP-type peptidyl-prolyl cis-trans isomerase/cyclophilin family peptidyl-prolyl cis-trans isomerase
MGQQCIPDGASDPEDNPGNANLNPMVTIETRKGRITIEVDLEDAPLAGRQFIEYVQAGYYDDTLFHEVLAGAWIAAGRYNQDYLEKSPRPVTNESDNGLHNLRGTVSLCTPVGQTEAIPVLHINLTDNPQMDYASDNGYLASFTVIGDVVEGMASVDAIGGLKTEHRGFGLAYAPKREVPVRRIYNGTSDAPYVPPTDEPEEDEDDTGDENDDQNGDDDDTGDDTNEGEDDDDDQTDEEGFITTDSGLQYKDVVEGSGDLVTTDSEVTVYYTGRLEDENGDVFDTTEGGDPRTFSLSGLIDGWQEGLGQYDMRAGGKRILIIPPELGYGPLPNGDIPANSTLWFEIEVVEVDNE